MQDAGRGPGDRWKCRMGYLATSTSGDVVWKLFLKMDNAGAICKHGLDRIHRDNPTRITMCMPIQSRLWGLTAEIGEE